MSDPTDAGQRNPLSSSSSHASGTSARSVSVQPDQAQTVMSMATQDEVAASAPPSGDEGGSDHPKFEAEAGNEFAADISPETGDAAAAPAMEQPEPAGKPLPAQEFVSSSEPGSWDDAEHSQPAEAPAEAPESEGHPAIVASVDAMAETTEKVSAFVEEAVIEPSVEVVSALRAAARQSIAENEARQAQTMVLFEQVSRRFTVALEEAGVDAARVTFKVMEFAQASLKNNLELAKSYAAARSVPDIFGLHAAYLKRQFELLNAQAEELREITAKFALRNTAALKPSTDQTAKTLDNR